ncbi:MAG: hypothetical protein J0L92_03405 [Deltaproteobacteria bacterium]|nr:hypothetical protein [Deltaproteobacteria bacterium]
MRDDGYAREQKIRQAAIHEAGHIVAAFAYVQGGPVLATIKPGPDADLGRVHCSDASTGFDPPNSSLSRESHLVGLVRLSLAGIAAEQLARDQAWSREFIARIVGNETNLDGVLATEYARALEVDSVTACLVSEHETTVRFLKRNWSHVETFAEALLRRGTLDQQDLAAIRDGLPPIVANDGPSIE